MSLPQYFKQHGYTTLSFGKVIHPNLPPHYDYPLSWTLPPVNEVKPPCPDNTMTCPYNASDLLRNVDLVSAKLAVDALTVVTKLDKPWFVAVGLQGPRLPWAYPIQSADRLPPPSQFPLPVHKQASTASTLEWFRPTEVDMYSDVRDCTHDRPMPDAQQQEVRRAYYAAITNVDDQVGTLLSTLDTLGVTNDTLVVLIADHAQNLGELNTWTT